MNDKRFDTLTRGFSTLPARMSRRVGLRLLTGGTLIYSLRWPGDPLVEAKKNQKRKAKRQPRKCKAGKKPCGKFCIGMDLCCTSKDCPGCQRCYSDGRCAEPVDLVPLCNSGVCQKLACNKVKHEWECQGCSSGNTCCHGVCQPDTERCCATAGWKVCPGGGGACCDDPGQCTKNGRYCCAEGLVACDQNCAIGSC